MFCLSRGPSQVLIQGENADPGLPAEISAGVISRALSAKPGEKLGRICEWNGEASASIHPAAGDNRPGTEYVAQRSQDGISTRYYTRPLTKTVKFGRPVRCSLVTSVVAQW